ncbi:MAG: serine/threonine protein kinase [Clostridia bacterium]|nr:serine/threonine protein kinase [Clostridia bacterium]
MIPISSYEEISSFNENTSLVQYGDQKYVKKRVPKELTSIYEILCKKRHKNISEIIEVYAYEDCTIVIEAYIDGSTLADVLKSQGVFSQSQTKRIIGQICDGLCFLHDQNIIHRDINTNNIMLTKDGNVKIIDFDICRSVKSGTTQDTTILGTVGYAAPEQFGFAQSDSRTDVYAVAVLANVMLTGDFPHQKKCRGRIGSVIRKATAIDPSMRYKDISKFRAAFTGATDERTPLFIRMLRCAPGYRTGNPLYMLIATFYYFTYIPLMIAFLYWAENTSDFFLTLMGNILMLCIPPMLLTNVFGWRDKIANTPLKRWVYSILVSFLSFFIGACILSQILI